MKNDPYTRIFFKKIVEYTKENRKRTHYLNLGEGVLMVIHWKGNSWTYTLRELEKDEQDINFHKEEIKPIKEDIKNIKEEFNIFIKSLKEYL